MMNTTMPQNSEMQRAALPDIDELAGKALKLALFINLLIPALLIIAVYILSSMDMMPRAMSYPADTLQLMYFVLLAVALSEMVAALILRKAMFAPEKVRPVLGNSGEFSKLVMTGTTALAALGASPVIYALVLYILGEDISKTAIFPLVTLVHFRLFRPSAEFLREVVRQAQAQ
jgi:hypothetical protein